MKVKIFHDYSAECIEDKINEFLSQPKLEVVSVQFCGGVPDGDDMCEVFVMVVYKEL